jgi:hypothetical protein
MLPQRLRVLDDGPIVVLEAFGFVAAPHHAG